MTSFTNSMYQTFLLQVFLLHRVLLKAEKPGAGSQMPESQIPECRNAGMPEIENLE